MGGRQIKMAFVRIHYKREVADCIEIGLRKLRSSALGAAARMNIRRRLTVQARQESSPSPSRRTMLGLDNCACGKFNLRFMTRAGC